MTHSHKLGTRNTRRWAAISACGLAAVMIAGAPSSPRPVPRPIDVFTFDGGTIREYTDLVRESCPDTNIVVDDRIAHFRVPAMELRSIDVDSLMWVLEDRPGDWRGLACTCEVDSHPAASGPLYRLSGRIERSTRGRGAVRTPDIFRETSVRSVADLIAGGMTSESIVAAMEIAVDMNGHDPDEMAIVFHSSTGLLIMHGPSDAIEICRDVLAESTKAVARPERVRQSKEGGES